MMGVHIGICEKCEKEGRLYPSFGKWICTECKNNRPRKGTGNSGMFQSKAVELCFSNDLQLIRCKKSNDIFGAMFFRHYPGSKGIPGRSLCYLISYNSEIIGIIGFNSPPKNYTFFTDFFGKNKENSFFNK